MLRREFECYQALLKEINNTVNQLYVYVTGHEPLPNEIEKLWRQIQENKIPKSWLAHSYGTAHDSLGEYVIELVEKLKYWTQVFNEFDNDSREPIEQGPPTGPMASMLASHSSKVTES